MGSAGSTTPISLWYRRLSRRELLARGSDLAVLSALTSGCASLAQQEQGGARLGFQAVTPSYEDTLDCTAGATVRTYCFVGVIGYFLIRLLSTQKQLCMVNFSNLPQPETKQGSSGTTAMV